MEAQTPSLVLSVAVWRALSMIQARKEIRSRMSELCMRRPGAMSRRATEPDNVFKARHLNNNGVLQESGNRSNPSIAQPDKPLSSRETRGRANLGKVYAWECVAAGRRCLNSATGPHSYASLCPTPNVFMT